VTASRNVQIRSGSDTSWLIKRSSVRLSTADDCEQDQWSVHRRAGERVQIKPPQTGDRHERIEWRFPKIFDRRTIGRGPSGRGSVPDWAGQPSCAHRAVPGLICALSRQVGPVG
jgi:hypothetical protein